MRNEKEIAVHAYKFNGWLYRTWEFPKIIEETDEYICLLSNGSRVITADKKKDNVFHHSKITAPTI
jgi:protein associated with RNAse G/E